MQLQGLTTRRTRTRKTCFAVLFMVIGSCSMHRKNRRLQNRNGRGGAGLLSISEWTHAYVMLQSQQFRTQIPVPPIHNTDSQPQQKYSCSSWTSRLVSPTLEVLFGPLIPFAKCNLPWSRRSTGPTYIHRAQQRSVRPRCDDRVSNQTRPGALDMV